MTGPAAVESEVVGGLDDARAEVVMPEPVDDDPGEERVRRMRQPLGQHPAAIGLGGVGR